MKDIKCCHTCWKQNKEECPFHDEQFDWCDGAYWVPSEEYTELIESHKMVKELEEELRITNEVKDAFIESFNESYKRVEELQENDRKLNIIINSTMKIFFPKKKNMDLSQIVTELKQIKEASELGTACKSVMESDNMNGQTYHDILRIYKQQQEKGDNNE